MDTRTMGAWLWRAFALVFGIAALVEADESTHKVREDEEKKRKNPNGEADAFGCGAVRGWRSRQALRE